MPSRVSLGGGAHHQTSPAPGARAVQATCRRSCASRGASGRFVTGGATLRAGMSPAPCAARARRSRRRGSTCSTCARLRRAVDGCDAVVHVAALYSFTASERELELVNVQGTRNVIEAADGRRLLATSSCATCGPVPGRQATEADSPPDWELAVPYKRTKLEAERLVLAAGGTCVNPTTPVGDGDRAPTPTGAMIRGVATGRYRAYPRIGVNVVDVRDVARGHVLALEHGRPGERYLLGGADLTMRELFAAVARLAGRPRAAPGRPVRGDPCRRRARARQPERGDPRPHARVLLVGEGRARARLPPRPGRAGARRERSLVLPELPADSVPRPITARKIRPTISMPVMTSRPSVAASASSASIGGESNRRAGVQRAPGRRSTARALRARAGSTAGPRARPRRALTEQRRRRRPGLAVAGRAVGPQPGAERDQLGEVGDRLDLARARRCGRGRGRRGSRRAAARCRGRPARSSRGRP